MNCNWVIFDADNTLWAVEHLYDSARDNLCQYLAARGISYGAAKSFQEKRDKELYASYGYSACRFARSFEDTILNFEPLVTPQDIRHVRNLALEVFERKAVVSEGLEGVLKDLARNYRLGIITAGERWVQEKRLLDFHLSSQFSAIEIVEEKKSSVFSVFCDRHGVNRQGSWVIGDSLNSDIIPARAAGVNAVLYATRNWSPVEGDHAEIPGGVPVVQSLTELREHLLQT